MKTKIKIGLAFVLFATTISCTKENINKVPGGSAIAADNNIALRILHIGDSYRGGTIFYLDSTRRYGLIAATSDMDSTLTWWNGTSIITGANKTGIGFGNNNTNKIIAAEGKPGNYAALLCSKDTSGGFSDWFLPSKGELNQLYRQKAFVGGLVDTMYYWSSSESTNFNDIGAWAQVFYDGHQVELLKYDKYRVRAVRAF